MTTTWELSGPRMGGFTYVPIITGEGKPELVAVDASIMSRRRGLKDSIVATKCAETNGRVATTDDIHLFGLDGMLRDGDGPQWWPIESAPLRKFVLVRCPSGYTATPYRILVATFEPSYERAFVRWRDHAGDAVTDSGELPDAWMPLEPLLSPVIRFPGPDK